PIAGHGVEEDETKLIAREPPGDRIGRMLVGEEELDRLEAGAGGRVEPAEKADVLEHHAQIGGEFWQGGGSPVYRRRSGRLLLPPARVNTRAEAPRGADDTGEA